MPTEAQDSFLLGATLDARATDPRLCAKLEHCRVESDGSVMTRAGSIRCTPQEIEINTCYGVHMFRDAGGTRRFVALIGTTAYKAATTAAGPWTSAATGLSGNYADFTEFRFGSSNYLIWSDGVNTKAFDGSSVTAPSSVPAGAGFVRAFNDRLWVGVRDTNKVYASKVRDFNTWAVPDGIALQIGGARPVTGMEVAGPHLLVFKSEETERVSGYGNTDVMVAAGSNGVSQSVGCVNFRTIQPCGDMGVAWLSLRGIEFYSPAKGYAECVSGQIEKFFQPLPASVTAGTSPVTMNPGCYGYASFGYAHSYYDTRRGEYHLFVLDSNNAQAEVVFVPQTGACYLWPYQGAFNDARASCYAATAPPVAGAADYYPLSIDSEGYPLLREYGTTDFADSDGTNGTTITGTVRTRSFTFGQPNRTKHGRVIRASLRNVTAGNLDVTVRARTESGGGTDHTSSVPLAGTLLTRARVSVRGTDLYAEVDLRPGLALDSIEMDGEIYQRSGAY